MKIYAPAKVNLALDVVGQMANGYHELDMIMAPISLYDELDIEISQEDKITCQGMELPENNTIIKAISLLRERFRIKNHYSINVIKNIPSCAGLAGGSADAAAIMRAIYEIENIDISLAEKLELAKKVGADVPFCMVNQYARVKGIGERIECIDTDWKFKILLVKPSVGISTPEAFKLWHQKEPMHPDLGYAQMACENKSLDLLVQAMGNALEPIAFELESVLNEIKEDMLKLEIVRVMMSGSGSSMMGFSIDETVLEKAREILKEKYEFVEIVTVG